jgi:hypothetical protein
MAPAGPNWLEPDPVNRWWVGLGACLALATLATAPVAADGLFDPCAEEQPPPECPYRAFSPVSTWNTPIASWPADPASDEMLAWLASKGALGVRLAGTEIDGGWGDPIYWAEPSDPRYVIQPLEGYPLPPEFTDPGIRIPAGAQPAASEDGELTVYDLADGWVVKLYHASYSDGQWYSRRGSIYYLASNGLHGWLPESDDPRNLGHRGFPPAIHAVRYDELLAGRISHAIKVAVPESCDHAVWPGINSDGDSTDPTCLPQGARVRLKRGYDLSSLPRPARIIGRTLKRYGMVVGDSGDAPGFVIKLENCVVEGSGPCWEGMLTELSLASIPLTAYEVVELGYRGGSA